MTILSELELTDEELTRALRYPAAALDIHKREYVELCQNSLSATEIGADGKTEVERQVSRYEALISHMLAGQCDLSDTVVAAKIAVRCERDLRAKIIAQSTTLSETA